LAKRRDQIRLTEDEMSGFLDEQRVINVCTLGADGWPHVTALWYVRRDGQPWIYTYRKSQKVKNLERDSRATLLVEAGEQYNELRGVMLKANATVHDDFDTVAGMSEAIFIKYQGGKAGSIDDATREALRSQVPKRAAIQFDVKEIVSWDHAKLGGTY
jgi:PPOX class probable F420-dependent enzyme